MKTLAGGCPCGAVRFRVEVERFEASECNCSICTKNGIPHLIVDTLSVYTFNTGVAQHRFCRRCGIHPFYTPRSHPNDVDVNIRCLDDDAWRRFSLTTFDGKNWERPHAAR